MKYRILLSGGSSTIVSEFFRFTDSRFKCLTTSSCITDILNHFELFQPDAYICFIDSEFSDALSKIDAIKASSVYNGAPVIVVGPVEACNAIESRDIKTPDMLIKRPISTDNLSLSVVRFLERRAEAGTRPVPPPASAEEPPAEEKSAAAPAKKHVLVVDDDRSILKLLKTALSDEYEVTTMLNGVLVEKFLSSRQVDIIILDYEMPIETGADIFRKIKKNSSTENIPVCFLTGVSEREKIIEIMRLKPHGYLLKPIDMDMLRAAISNLTA
ncbi:MAG: two-component system response regulator [Oscillospiraceae bacterium]